MLREELKQYFEVKKETTKFYIENGYCNSWADEHKKYSDNGIRHYSTEKRFEQYTTGAISREKVVELTIKRANKQIEKEYKKYIERINSVENAPELDYITLSIEWKRSRTWGSNPTAESRSNNGFFIGSASGCGYDKESSAVATAFNKDFSILKVLYDIKENALKNGESDHSDTAITNIDNRNIIGYGSGYFVLPYFEGGVGVNCFWDILKKGGYKINCNYGKHENFYNIYRG